MTRKTPAPGARDFPGQCGYHFGTPVADLRLVQLRQRSRRTSYRRGGCPDVWSPTLAICGRCRVYLKGLFRYASASASVSITIRGRYDAPWDLEGKGDEDNGHNR